MNKVLKEKREKVRKMLMEKFDQDNTMIGDLDNRSWQLGFQRGMEYHKGLDDRVINMAKGAENIIKRFIEEVEE